jgi:hypothetical protein
MTDDELTGVIIGCAMKVHRKSGAGFLHPTRHRLAAEFRIVKPPIQKEIPGVQETGFQS